MIPTAYAAIPVVNYNGVLLNAVPIANRLGIPRNTFESKMIDCPLIFSNYPQAASVGQMGIKFNFLGQAAALMRLPGGIHGVIIDTTPEISPAGNWNFYIDVFFPDTGHIAHGNKNTFTYLPVFTGLQEFIVFCTYQAPAPGPSILGSFPPVHVAVTNVELPPMIITAVL